MMPLMLQTRLMALTPQMPLIPLMPQTPQTPYAGAACATKHAPGAMQCGEVRTPDTLSADDIRIQPHRAC